MSDQQSHDERLDELLALAALGELTAADERELDAALADDVGLRHELDADLDVAARIQAVNTATPSAELKDRVMAAIDDPIVAADVPTPPPTAPVVDLGAERERRRPRWMPMAAAAAVALVAIGGVVMINDRDSGNDVVAEVIEATDANEWDFGGELPGALRAVYSADVDALVLEGVDVGGLTDAETYQLWRVDPAADTVESVGVFRPDDDGRVLVAFEGADPTDVTLGITVEPAGGSDEPTFPIVASLDTTA